MTTTANDEHNLLIGVVGKALGAKKSVAVVRREMLMRLTDYIAVDAMVNPNQALATVIMKQVRYPFGTGALSIIDEIDAEVLELTIPRGSAVSGKKIMDLGLPKDTHRPHLAEGRHVRALGRRRAPGERRGPHLFLGGTDGPSRGDFGGRIG